MVKKIIEFWKQSYYTDRIAFYCELISFVFTVGASMVLAINAVSPDMRYVYPGFFIGAIAGCYGYYRRLLVWPMLLTGYFIIVNIFGFGRALGYW